MKLHTLAAVVLGALASHAAFADPEADFWQPQEPKVSLAAGLGNQGGTDRKSEQTKSDTTSVSGTAAKPEPADGIHAFGLSVPAEPAKPESAQRIDAFGLSVPAGARERDSADGIDAFGLGIHGDSNRQSAQTKRDQPGV